MSWQKNLVVWYYQQIRKKPEDKWKATLRQSLIILGFIIFLSMLIGYLIGKGI